MNIYRPQVPYVFRPPRDAVLRFAPPLDLRVFLREQGLAPKAAAEPLTQFLAEAIRRELV